MRLTSTVRTATAALAATILSAGLVTATGSSSAAAGAPLEVLADFEGGSPPDFFVYQGGGSAVTAEPTTVPAGDPRERPGQQGDNAILDVDFTVGDFGGFGQDLAPGGPDDWSSYGAVSLWFLGTGSGLAYQVEIADNRSDPATDTAERFDHTFTDDAAGWRQLTIPFSDFTRATDFQPAGAPDDGLGLTEVWSWAVVLPQGADSVPFDDIALGYQIVDDFESPLPTGDDNGVSTGFSTFQGAGATIAIDRSQTAPDLPGASGANAVLRMEVDSSSYAGFVHAFSDDTGAWVSQDWSRSAGLRLWFYGAGSGSSMFVDLLDNRNPGSTVDDAERWTTEFVDDVDGWRLLEIPFSSLTRKEIGNGAPNDGLGLDAVHGYAVGVLGTGAPRTFFVDDVALYGVGEVAPLRVRFSRTNQRVEEGTTGDVLVSLSRALGADDPDEVSVGFRTEEEGSIAIADREYTPTSGTLTFVKGGPSELSFPLETFDDTKWEGDERIVVRLVDFDGVLPGGPSETSVQGSVFIADNDPLDPLLVDDFERGAYLWEGDGVSLSAPDVARTDEAARPEQDRIEALLEVSTPVAVDIEVQGAKRGCRGNGVVTVHLLSTADFDATEVDHTTVRYGEAAETHRVGRKKTPARHVEDVNGDGLQDLVFHFRTRETGYGCDQSQGTLTGELRNGTPIVGGGDPVSFGRDFALDQDWSQRAGLSFWYDGDGSGDEVVVTLKDNRAPDPGPDGWDLAWSQEFDAEAGTPPDPDVWNFEIGDVTPDGKNGWGNDELEFYTDDPANAAMDGDGNLAVTLDAADGSRECYYGPCEYTSARLTSWNKAEFAYGRIESRIKVPGGTGIWPAFWSLGTDIDVVQWPQTGEIDFMEYVGRLPDEIFGTIHGPGYAGGESYGGIYDFGAPVEDDFHTYTVEWEPDLIRWYVDGILYHQAEPADVSPREWVFNDPVFLLLNVAVGGNFGGPVGEDLTTPASMLVDYVRVYQGPDTAERFEATFTDSEAGWRRVTVPFEAFERSDVQPEGAPDDGLGLDAVWGYGFRLPEGGTTSGTLRLDQVMLDRRPKPAEVEVTTAANSGAGSLRAALEEVAEGGTITFDPALAGSTIRLQGPLSPAYDVTIDASAASDVTLDGAGDRVLVVPPGVSVTGRHLVLTGGYGYQLGGGVLNNGSLELHHSTVTGNTTTTDAGDFWQGGGGIYSGDGASLTLVDSTVSDNTADWSGGGIYSFLNTTTRLVRSTVSGNVTGDVGGGLRILGDLEVENSTISGNTATGWHGGALFVTDGSAVLRSSTVTDNDAPAGTAGGLFVGTFGDSTASLENVNSIVAGNSGDQCFLAPFGAGAVSLTSGGGNVLGDGTCAAGAEDVQTADAGLGPLADNGGPTWTHALLAGSAAVDAALPAQAPATDQRGVARPQGGGPDSGAYERE